MTGWARGTALLVVLLLPLTASAFGWRSRTPAATANTPARVVYVPTYYVPAYVDPCPIPVAPPLAVPGPAPIPARLRPTFAPPTAAPPSGTPAESPMPAAPPMSKVTAASVSESRSYYNIYPVVARDGSSAGTGRCAIGFWNHSSQRLTLKVDGKTHVLNPGSKIAMNLGLQFAWQIDGREAHVERVPEGESALEIVIRQ